MKRKKLRIFIGPQEIAGYYANLSRGFKKLGVECDFITYDTHPFEYGQESRKPRVLVIALWLRSVRKRVTQSQVKEIVRYSEYIVLYGWVLHAILRYNTFIFGFGLTLLPGNKDLPILRLFRKKIISNLAHGSEARPPYVSGFAQSKYGERLSTEKLINKSARIKSKVSTHERWADVIIGAPFSTSHFSNYKFVNHFCIGLPIQIPLPMKKSLTDQIPSEINNNKNVRILHSPSHPAGKGSSLISAAVNRLKDKGYTIDFVMLHGRPHAEILSELQQCDFVVDQVFSDTPMAGFATEAAWFGKATVVGGYGLEALKAFVPKRLWPPSKICHPENIESAIEELILDQRQRARIERDAQEFVRDNWIAIKVARRYLEIIEDQIPDEWWIDPSDVFYLEGVGQPMEYTKENVRKIVNSFGAPALHLSHRPDLERAFLEFSDLQH